MLQYKFPKRAIHFDFHNMPGAPAIGEEFDGDLFGRSLRAAGVELITFFAKDSNGNAYYPTKIGVMHPGLKFDLVGEVIKSCRKYGINIVIYLNAGYDNTAALAHRDWCKVDEEGRIAPPGNFYDTGRNGYYLRSMCPNTGYKQYLLAMIDELLPYGMDGIFLDCYNTLPCYGSECIHKMREAGLDVHNPADARKLADDSMHQWIEDTNHFIRKKNPKINIYHNGLTYAKQLNHIEIEVLPNGGWGYDYLPAALHYSRTLKLPVVTMAGRFHASWGDVNGLRTQASQEFDFYNSIANGAECMIGDHFPAGCAFQDAVYQSARAIFDRVGQIQQFVGAQRILTEIAILDPGMRNFPEGRYENNQWNWCLRETVRGATRLLGELKQQFDIVDDQADFSCYRLLIIPEDVRLSDTCRQKITAFVENGGKVISAGHGGYDRDRQRWIDGVYQGIEVVGDESAFYNYLLPRPVIADGLSQTMPITNYTRGGVRLQLTRPAEELAQLFPSISQRDGFDGEFLNYYVMPDLKRPLPALAWNGRAAHFATPFFQSYYDDAIVQMKQIFANLLRLMLPDPMIQCENFPSFGRITIGKSGHDTLIHLLNFVPEKRGHSEIIEEGIIANNVLLKLRNPSGKLPSQIKTLTGSILSFRQNNGTLEIPLPSMTGYEVIKLVDF